MSVLGGDELGVQVDVCPALLQGRYHPRSGIVGDLGQDPALRLDEMEVEVGEAELGVAVEQ